MTHRTAGQKWGKESTSSHDSILEKLFGSDPLIITRTAETGVWPQGRLPERAGGYPEFESDALSRTGRM